MTAKKRSFSVVLILVADLADPSSTLAWHQRIVFLRKQFTKLRLLPFPADIDESGAGATSAARERLELIEPLPLLDATLETDQLAAALIAAKAIPETEPRDAFHLSIAATNGF